MKLNSLFSSHIQRNNEIYYDISKSNRSEKPNYKKNLVNLGKIEADDILMKPFNQILSILIIAIIALTIASTGDSYGQTGRKQMKKSRSMSKWRYRSAIQDPAKVCHVVNKKRVKGTGAKSKYRGGKKKRVAEGGFSGFNPYGNDPKSSSRTVYVEKKDTQPAKSLADMSLDEKHHVEDDVLKKNKLPEPSSEKHEQIRKDVEKHLANFEEETPIKLDPLYFVTDQDEFAFVDMDPFLIAAEYALQGKHILIEGHTDAKGQSSYNVQLSIKRVERIRQLMVDMGVSDDHISVVGYGEEHSEDADAAKDAQLDRRVDFTVF